MSPFFFHLVRRGSNGGYFAASPKMVRDYFKEIDPFKSHKSEKKDKFSFDFRSTFTVPSELITVERSS